MSADVAIIMGSDSDLLIMQPAADILAELGVASDVDIVSAHRTPEKMFTFARGAIDNGYKVIIAGAGGAAHLPGMVAALTVLPVIGIPVSATKLAGQDSLLSIVQMPKGIPVATVAIDNSANAGLLAAQILGAFDPELQARLKAYRNSLEEMVGEMSRRVRGDG
ncbi:MAG: 5-(carboxyamino)imidazole ribonucleotide mutase [Gammaproteobacteria bacterium]|nr:5-(carboxyamino)imidazole ribonucleotide mutase [Gammaproteobacteria bacterium]RPG23582.1 MAG: 5-(carboxyamino)imidazole ribonucleotide mutase [Gammaproteobacteria bacterium TMED50]|tara:strand:+ start:649 stop:1140 length:492 start_codon:yes stop_codon:yes gene_type:complete